MSTPNIDTLGPWQPHSATAEATVRALVANQPDAAMLLDALGAGEWS